MDEKLGKPYNPGETEDRIYKLWQDSGFFNPDVCVDKGVTQKDAPVFSMVLPPPNATGILHTGHASMVTIEDIMVRFSRMRGKRTLWVPGTDHAAIATNTKVEKEMIKKEGVNRHAIGREAFIGRVEEFVAESRGTIVGQVKRMGASLDWSREAFTLDDKRQKAVFEAFKRMYDAGLVYRGYRIVNWDPKGQTTISDDEIVYEERKGKLYTFRYSSDFPIPIATTRPETKLGDTGVAVHPDDARYKEYVGKVFDVDFAGTKLSLKVVADASVDPEFGTGAVGLTPAHSFTDWEIGERHGLEVVPVINEYAKISLDCPYKDMKVAEAREKIIEWLSAQGLLTEEKEISQNVSTAERTGAVIEPLPKLQWFVNVNKKFVLEDSSIDGIPSGSETSLKEIMRQAIAGGQVAILPERFEKVYFHWIDNLRDWTISRQLWYGHRIPVWYRGEEIRVSESAPDGGNWKQDEDTLDTWFSSGLWTFSTLGWPDKTEDLKLYHPTSVLETGYDILFFWVARMVLMSGFLLGQVPFRTIYLHGLVRDEKGRKISKSLGNSIDPVLLIDKYGADALRMALIVGVGPGSDANLGESKIKGYKNFANKIWNASRFVLENLEGFDPAQEAPSLERHPEHAEWLKEFDDLKADITEDIEGYRFHLAAEKLYHYFWHTFADVIIEKSKPLLKEESSRSAIQYALWSILSDSIRALHPFMPFLTEELWSLMPHGSEKLLMVERWPAERRAE